jgi:hypothetical protein
MNDAFDVYGNPVDSSTYTGAAYDALGFPANDAAAAADYYSAATAPAPSSSWDYTKAANAIATVGNTAAQVYGTVTGANNAKPGSTVIVTGKNGQPVYAAAPASSSNLTTMLAIGAGILALVLLLLPKLRGK